MRIRREVLASVAVVMVICLAAGWHIDHTQKTVLAKLQAGLDESIESGEPAAEGVEHLMLWLQGQGVQVPGGYSINGIIDMDENKFWGIDGNEGFFSAGEMVENCRRAKIVRRHQQWQLDVDGFDGQLPEFWWALYLSRLPAATTDQKRRAWQTERYFDHMMSIAESDPADFIRQRSEIEQEVDEATVKQLLAKDLPSCLRRESPDGSPDQAIADRWQEIEETRQGYEENISGWKAQLAKLRQDGWVQRSLKDPETPPKAVAAQWREDIKGLEEQIAYETRHLSELPTRQHIREEVLAERANTQKRQMLFDKCRQKIRHDFLAALAEQHTASAAAPAQ